ncbi:hypothetical protein F5Y10DRAFT_285611 [Nemania abortiva]|nr:hypothetical protein F5Y10DRAFT_285611 [Nemania abortiva]
MSSRTHGTGQVSNLQAAQEQVCAKMRNICTVMEHISETTTDRSTADSINSLIGIISEILSEVTSMPVNGDQEPERDITDATGSSGVNDAETTPVTSANDEPADQTNREEGALRANDSPEITLASSNSTRLLGTEDTEDNLDEEGSPVINSDSGTTSQTSATQTPATQTPTITKSPPIADTAVVTPFPYTVGQVLELKTPEGKQLFATITKAYSITMSPVLVVQLSEWAGPQEAILKLYDRRFGNQRKKNQYSDDPPEPHTAQAEAAWQRYIREGLAEPLLRELQREHDSWLEDDDDTDDGTEDGTEDDDKGDGEDEDGDDSEDEHDDRPEWERLGEQEGKYYYGLRNDYITEVRAYKELQELQGRYIPRLFSTVVFDMPSAQSDLPVAYFQVTGILIEKIDGFTLSDLIENTPKESLSLWQKIVQDTIDCVAEVNRHGVMHSDCSARNVVVSSSSGNGYQPYLVDFARASFKSDFTRRKCIIYTEEYYDRGGCNCWRCMVTLCNDPAEVGFNMLNVVKEATGHTVKFNLPDRDALAPVEQPEH